MNKNQQQLLLSVFFVFVLTLLLPSKVKGVITPFVTINRGDYYAYTRQISVGIRGPEGVREMKVSNFPDMRDGSWETYKTEKNWLLDYGRGTKVVYVKFKTDDGEQGTIYSDTIYLNAPDKMTVNFNINDNAQSTNSRQVTLNLTYSTGVDSIWISNTNNFASSEQQNPQSTLYWMLPSGGGVKTVYIMFKDVNNNNQIISKKINYIQPARYLAETSLIKGQSGTVYYLGYDGKIHPFLNSTVYHSWYKDFSGLTYVSDAKIGQYSIGEPVCVRPGTWLLKFTSLPKIYAVEPGCVLRPMLSQANAYLLYGSRWENRVLEMDPINNSFYTLRDYSVADAAKGIVDQDRDGVSKQVEDENGTDDLRTDSDADGLSDYEEIYYWFSDPVDPDTSHNGVKDGTEILRGFSPLGVKITSVPGGSYDYPYGTVLKNKNDNKYYYRFRSGRYCFMGNTTGDRAFVGNNFMSLFASESAHTMTIGIDRCGVGDTENDIKVPTNSTNGVVNLL